ncbi:hypothetical protein D3C76_1228140 [compost metagenome]
MLIAAPANMQMIVTQLMLDDFFNLISPIGFELMRIDLNPVTFEHITPTRRGQATVKQRFMGERNSEMIQ